MDENEEITETLKEFWKHEARGLKETEKEDDEGKSETSREVMDIEFNSSPAILGATLLKHASQFELQFPAIVNVLNMLYCRNYCDDLSCSTVKLDDAFEIFQKTKEILAKGGFNLRKWRTNDKGLLQEIEQVEKWLIVFCENFRIMRKCEISQNTSFEVIFCKMRKLILKTLFAKINDRKHAIHLQGDSVHADSLVHVPFNVR